MRQTRTITYGFLRRLALLSVGGSTFILSSCDPTLQATVEDGIITVSNQALASFLTALLELAGEAS